ncbi:MAG: hypothetical protein GXO86_05450 [Chlorobi bacterium]|nr:hypothetical protein [Chlorobiota bacterium]
MINLTCILLLALTLAVLLVALFFIPSYISRQNKAVFEYLKENQEFMRSQFESAAKHDSHKTFVTLSLQAYERLALFLERINPPNLISRMSKPGQKVAQMQAVLLNTIREEYEHNMSQQLYVSNLAWDHLIRARNEVEMLINKVASDLDRNGDGMELARGIINKTIEDKKNPVDQALYILKQELRKNF